jgi:hypothetical protein
VVHINTVEYVSGLRFGGLDPTEEVQAVAAATGESIPGLLDQIGLALALGFETGDLSYQFCDDLVNHLFALHCDSALGPDSLFWRVFGAFDEGEFRHVHPTVPQCDRRGNHSIRPVTRRARMLSADRL